jgi:hypothetical protein
MGLVRLEGFSTRDGDSGPFWVKSRVDEVSQAVQVFLDYYRGDGVPQVVFFTQDGLVNVPWFFVRLLV